MNKEKFIIIGSLCALALVVAFLIMPAFDSLSADSQIMSDKKTNLDKIKTFNQKIEQLNKQYKSEELERLLSVLPRETEESSLLTQLEGLATSNGLIMESVDFNEIALTDAARPQGDEDIFPKAGSSAFQPKTAQAEPSYKVVNVILKLSGGYGPFKNYLQAVEKNLRLMDVVSLSMNNGSAGQSFSFGVNLRVYYQ